MRTRPNEMAKNARSRQVRLFQACRLDANGGAILRMEDASYYWGYRDAWIQKERVLRRSLDQDIYEQGFLDGEGDREDGTS